MALRKLPNRTQARVFSRRTALMGLGQAALTMTLVGRLYYLQVLQADKYRLLADENRINLRLLPPSRGLIYDRFGLALADNYPNYRAMLVAEQTSNLARTLDDFSALVPLSERERAKIMKELSRVRAFTPIPVKEDLDWDQVSAVELNLPDLPGISIEVDQKRVYPFAGIAAHMLGYVGAPNEDDLQQDNDPLLSLPGIRMGKNGLEKQYEHPLRGQAGQSELEVNSVGRVIRELAREEGTPGKDLVTSLDIGLQQFVQQRLSAEFSGAAVVMDIYNGDILAMASTPTFDPAAFYRGLTASEWQALMSDQYRPLTNKAIAGQFAPGSTFKIATAIAAQQVGVTPAFNVFCPGFYQLGNMRFHCWKKEGHGHLDMPGALQNSCDVYFYELSRTIGIDAIAVGARELGLGDVAGIDLPGERPGVIPDRAWKKATMGESWHQGETLINGIGQGFVLATPLQLCTMASRVANGGYAVKPHLFRAADPQKADGPSPYPKMKLEDSWLQTVRDGMDRVCNVVHGTAYQARIPIPGMEMAGKTGSAQVRRITMAERAVGVRKNESLPWKERDHALFVAFAPVHEPRYACCVVIEHGGGGALYAGPIARDIMIETQRRDPARRNPNNEGGRREMP
ncbi:MAG TPA: penicillin-binding protein 2 [Candidatus Cybelea sp.]|nr:penicillin-binding protein 2 [Candidatus Cybelea sp.]